MGQLGAVPGVVLVHSVPLMGLSIGDSVVWALGTLFEVCAARVGQYLLVCYKDPGRAGVGVARTVAIVDGVLSFGQEYEFSSETDGVGADSLVVAGLDQHTAVVCWRQAATNIGLAKVVRRIGDALTFGAEYQFYPNDDDTVPGLCCLSVAALSGNRAVLAFLDSVSELGVARVATLSGTDLDFGDGEVIFRSEAVSSIAVAGLGESLAAVCYRAADGTGRVTTITVDEDGEPAFFADTALPTLSDVNWLSSAAVRPAANQLAMASYESRGVIAELIPVGAEVPVTTTPPAPTTTMPPVPTTTTPSTTTTPLTTAPATTTLPYMGPALPPSEAGDLEHLAVAELNDDTMLLAYRSNARHRHGRVIAAQVAADGSVQFDQPLSFHRRRVEEVTAAAIDGRAVILYRVGMDMLARVVTL